MQRPLQRGPVAARIAKRIAVVGLERDAFRGGQAREEMHILEVVDLVGQRLLNRLISYYF